MKRFSILPRRLFASTRYPRMASQKSSEGLASGTKGPVIYPQDIPFTCLACDDPCSELDPEIAASIDTSSNMVGSIKPYARHFLVGSPAPWPSQIEEIPGSILPGLKERVKETLEGKSIFSATDGLSGIIEFPSRRAFERLPDPAQTIQNILSGTDASLVSQKAHILVCMHMNRDKRCGVLGPMIVETFQKEVSKMGLDSQVSIYGVSHVGGRSSFAMYLASRLY
jgi:hypothetical protein